MPPAPGESWLTRFDAFGPFHATAVGVFVALVAIWCLTGQRLRELDRGDGGGRERRFRRVVAWSFLGWQGFATVWRLLPQNFDVSESLPLHLCRFVGVAAPVAMLTMGWRLRAVTFFWGLGLSTHGVVTPMWHDGLGTVAFWLYWVGHFIIVGAAVYDLTVHGYRPTLRHLGFATTAGVMLTAAIAAFNLAAGTNYCYLGRGEYGGASVVDALGEWPARPALIIGGAAGVFVGMYGVALAAHRARRRAGARA